MVISGIAKFYKCENNKNQVRWKYPIEITDIPTAHLPLHTKVSVEKPNKH